MKKQRFKHARQHAAPPPAAMPQAAPELAAMEAFTFGDPTPVLDHADIMESLECWLNGKWYEPPVSWQGLAKSFNASVHHSSAIYFKTNILTSTFLPNKYLSRDAFKRLALDFLTFGNAYPEKRSSRTGALLQLNHALAKYMRRERELDSYFFVNGWQQEHAFDQGAIFHLMDPDLNQEVYGVPQYLSALQSAWLNESATLFRRKYYKNGSHAGFALCWPHDRPRRQHQRCRQSAQGNARQQGTGQLPQPVHVRTERATRTASRSCRCRDVAAKDEFFNIKGVTRDDVLAAHRVPPQLMGIMPNNTGGFGAIEPAARVFVRNELVPLQTQFLALNDWLGQEVVKFEPYELMTGEGKKQ